MTGSFLNDFSQALIRQVESACAASDPDEIGDAAAMVLVGDVYALRLCRGETEALEQAEAELPTTDDRVSPFIR